MPPTPYIAVEPRPYGYWAVERAGATRASTVFSSKSAAVDRARAQARREGADLVIKAQNGSIEE
jgi:hypothetical protein